MNTTTRIVMVRADELNVGDVILATCTVGTLVNGKWVTDEIEQQRIVVEIIDCVDSVVVRDRYQWTHHDRVGTYKPYMDFRVVRKEQR